jgi:hypothetical protein
MSTEFTFPPALSFLVRSAGPPRSIVQIYRFPKGHLNEIAWTADEAALAIEGNDFKFYCARCDEARLADPIETNSILAALGLPPAR